MSNPAFSHNFKKNKKIQDDIEMKLVVFFFTFFCYYSSFNIEGLNVESNEVF